VFNDKKLIYFAGYLSRYKYSSFIVLSSEGGGPRPLYGGLCMIGDYGEGILFSNMGGHIIFALVLV
jgi:hypothetical protein